MKMRSVVPMRIAKWGYVFISSALCILGMAAIVLPAPSEKYCGISLGILLLAFGIIKLVGYYSKDLFRLAFQYDWQFGLFLMIFGIIALLRPEESLNFLCIALAVYIILESLFKIRIAQTAKEFGIRSWWLVLVLALLSGFAGILLLLRPWESAVILLGINLLATGVLNIAVAIACVKIIRNQKPDVIDSDGYILN